MPSNRDSRYQERHLDSERDQNPSVDDLEEDDQDDDAGPKILKGNLLKSIFNKSANSMYSEEVKLSERVGIVSQDFNEKRQSARYRNYGCTFVVRNAHSDKINCLCFILNGVFATGSSDKTIKVWKPF